jgi:TRAP-type C4-dicarboxylate transport system permease small subunit
MNETTRKKLGTLCLVIASFLNPFGYDLLVYKLTQLTGNYWTTMHILYVLAALFFILFFIFYRINPIKHIKDEHKKITIKIKTVKNVKL